MRSKKPRTIVLLAVLTMCLANPTAAGNAQAAKKNAWVKKAGKTYYYNAKGKKSIGLKEIKGKHYYFDKKGTLYKAGWKTVKGKKYYFQKKNGAATTGAAKIGKKRYLFDAKGRLTGSGLQKYGKKRYYTKKGAIQTGLKTVKGKTYYFTTKGPAAKGWKTIKGKKYYFGSSGAALTGEQTIGGKTYQFSKKGVLQKELPTAQVPQGKNPSVAPMPPAQTADPEEPAEKPERPVEPEVQDPSVTVPAVNPVENNKENMNAAYSKLSMTISNSKSYAGNWPEEDWESGGYTKFMEVLGEAEAMLEATGQVIEEDSKWNLVFDASKGTFVNRQREFDPRNYPYTATELLQEAEKLKAYEEQCLKLQKEQVLTYYPEQSKAIFDAINEYRVKNGLLPMLWSDNVQKVSRLEAGARAMSYTGTKDEESEEFLYFRGHSYSQISMTASAGMMGAEEILNEWVASPNHKVALVEPGTIYAGVAYYTYNSAVTGVTWSKVILTTWLRDEEPTYEDGSTITTARQDLWPTILNCETDNTVFP